MQTQQRGSAWSIKLVFRLYQIFGYTFIYYLMYPVTFFYFLFAHNVKRSLKIYYAHVGIPFTLGTYFTHLRIFAVCLVDRFISRINPNIYRYSYSNYEELNTLLEEGGILLMSHYGGWAVSSNSAHTNNKIHIVMKEVILEGIKKIENSLMPSKQNITVIDLANSDLSVSIQIANALLEKELVAIMADRINHDKYKVALPFLGQMAYFNKNPFQIAYSSQKNLIAFFVVFTQMNTYKVIHKKIILDFSLSKEDTIKKAMQEYVFLYETLLQEHPLQWFNFYNFWEKK
jgi:predicted LPLAT superfamily acyltransferase